MRVIKFKLFFVGIYCVLPLDELSLCIIEENNIGNPDLGGRQADLLYNILHYITSIYSRKNIYQLLVSTPGSHQYYLTNTIS